MIVAKQKIFYPVLSSMTVLQDLPNLTTSYRWTQEEASQIFQYEIISAHNVDCSDR
jgi:hypothetical protein